MNWYYVADWMREPTITGLAETAENSARARRVGDLEMNLLPGKGGI